MSVPHMKDNGPHVLRTALVECVLAISGASVE